MPQGEELETVVDPIEEVIDEPETESELPEETTGNDEEEEGAEELEEVIVTIGDEEAPPQEAEKAPDWVRELRKSHREAVRKNRELEEKLKSLENPQPKAEPIGQKPKLEDFDYDSDQYESALMAWHEKKRKADEDARQAELAQEEINKAWQAKLEAYDQAKTELKVKDFDEAEFGVKDKFSPTQQGIILQGSDNPALVVYALGKNESRLDELAKITDPVKFAFAVAKLESQLKVSNRKSKPQPEVMAKPGTTSISGAVDSTLERLRAEAEKTGDLTKVMEYKRKHKAK